MRLTLFSKLSTMNQSVDDLCRWIGGLGVDSVNLLVRDGTTIAPTDPKKVAEAIRALQSIGVKTDIVSTDIQEASPQAEKFLATVKECGVSIIRIGHYPFDPTAGYAASFDRGRRLLSGLSELCERIGIIPGVHLHPETIHTCAALAVPLIKDLPAGVIADPGNQARDGSESWPLTLDLLGDKLVAVGCKNVGWYYENGEWHAHWTPILGEGMCEWPRMVKELKRRNYQGFLSLDAPFDPEDERIKYPGDLDSFEKLHHSHSPTPAIVQRTYDQVPVDLQAMRSLIAA